MSSTPRLDKESMPREKTGGAKKGKKGRGEGEGKGESRAEEGGELGRRGEESQRGSKRMRCWDTGPTSRPPWTLSPDRLGI